MEPFASNLRERAAQLGLSNAEVARRAGLSERRYAHYVSGTREPDLATLVRVAEILGMMPNDLLGFGKGNSKRSKRERLKDRLNVAANAMGELELELVTVQAEAVASRRQR